MDTSALKGVAIKREISVTDLVAAATALAIAGSTIYNLGFFWPVEWSYVSLLTPQDILIGSLIAIVPMALAVWQAISISKIVLYSKDIKLKSLQFVFLCVALVVFLGLAATNFYEYNDKLMWIYLLVVYLAIATSFALLNFKFKKKGIVYFFIAFSIIFVPFIVGVGSFFNSYRSESPQDVTIFGDIGAISKGKIVRITEKYLMIYDGTKVILLPMTEAKRIERFFQNGPARDAIRSLTSG